MDFSDRRDSGSAEDLRTSKIYSVPTRHFGVASRMVRNHLEKNGLPIEPSQVSHPHSQPGKNGSFTVAEWHKDPSEGPTYNLMQISGTGAQHEALKKRFNVTSHPQDGYGRGR